jgi:cytoskeletal protein CcmA (bactofilin family)
MSPNNNDANVLNCGQIRVTSKGAELMIESYLNEGEKYTDLHCNTNILEELDVSGNARLQSDLDVSGNARVQSRFDVCGNAILHKKLDVCGNSVLHGDLHVKQVANIDGSLNVTNETLLKDTLRVIKNTTLQQKLNVGGNSVLEGDLRVKQVANIDGSLNVTGATHLKDGLDVIGNVVVTGTITAKKLVTDISVNNTELHITGDALIDQQLTVSGEMFGKQNIDISHGVMCAYLGPRGKKTDPTDGFSNQLGDNDISGIEGVEFYALKNVGESITIQNIGDRWLIVASATGKSGGSTINNNSHITAYANDSSTSLDWITDGSFSSFRYNDETLQSIFLIGQHADDLATFIQIPFASDITSRQLTFKQMGINPVYISNAFIAQGDNTHDNYDSNYYFLVDGNAKYHNDDAATDL